MLALSLCVCFTGLAKAQVNGSVSGSVHYADGGKPAGTTSLWLEPAEPPKGPTIDPKTGEYDVHDTDGRMQRLPAKFEADGSFVVNGVPPGTYIVHTYAPPYLPADGTIYPTSNEAHVVTGPRVSPDALRVEVKAGQVTPIVVRLRLGGAVEGTVRMSDGSPFVSATKSSFDVGVDVERKLGLNSYARVGTSAHTDAKGHYRLEGLAPGEYIVFATVPVAAAPAAGLIPVYGLLPLYAPGTVRPSEATVVSIVGTEVAHADFTCLPTTALHRLEGSVAVNGEEALRNARVNLYPNNEGGIPTSTGLKADASFAFDGVPDGKYTISVEFSRQSDLVNVDAVRGTLRMRMLPSAYGTTTQDVRVAGQDIAGILIQPAQTQPTGNGR